MVTEWWELSGGFIEADVIRWREFVYERRGPKGRRFRYGGRYGGQRVVKVGERTVVAEVIYGPDEDGWVYLLVRAYDNVGYKKPGQELAPLPVGSEIKRKYKTIMNGEPERLPWSDENARAMLASKGNSEHVKRWMAMDDEEY